MRYALRVQYIGKNYAGSQLQLENGKPVKGISTIQYELEKALSTLIKTNNRNQDKDMLLHEPYSDAIEYIRPIKAIFSGRTDRGVNSIGQIIHFDTEKPIVASKFLYQMNEILPDDISVDNLKEVEDSFHAQKSAKSRYYRFEFINRRCKNAFDGDLLRVKFPVNIERMQKSLNYLLGEHDFSSFKSSGTLNPSKVCTLTKAECHRAEGDRVVIDIVGNRFLYNMVRTIVGTLLEIEGHNLSPEHMKNVLEAKDRSKAGQTVSPYGLTLVEVTY